VPLFSVVIPTYNRRELVEEALLSVKRQSLADFETIIVDDGSSDSTREWLGGLGSEVRVFTQANRGPGAARNLGVHHSRGEYVAFLDSDDLWFPWSLETYAQAIRSSGQAAFLAGKPLRFSRAEDLGMAVRAEVELRTFADYLAAGDEWRWWGVSSFVVRRETLLTAGGFTDAWVNGEDADLALRLGMARGFVQITAPFTFGYREHDASAMKDSQRTLAGAWQQVRAEESGQYPGGSARARERWQILTRHLRPVTLDCLRLGLRRDAWGLYRAMFRWHFALGRWKYLAGFPMKALCSRRNRP
jgi:glycosyltransferase involved in cell wall biosynthesis